MSFEEDSFTSDEEINSLSPADVPNSRAGVGPVSPSTFAPSASEGADAQEELKQELLSELVGMAAALKGEASSIHSQLAQQNQVILPPPRTHPSFVSTDSLHLTLLIRIRSLKSWALSPKELLGNFEERFGACSFICADEQQPFAAVSFTCWSSPWYFLWPPSSCDSFRAGFLSLTLLWGEDRIPKI